MKSFKEYLSESTDRLYHATYKPHLESIGIN